MENFTERDRKIYYNLLDNHPRSLESGVEYDLSVINQMRLFLYKSKKTSNNRTYQDNTTIPEVSYEVPHASEVPHARPVYEASPAQSYDHRDPPIRVVHHHNSGNNDFWFWMWLFDRNQSNNQQTRSQNTRNTSNENSNQADFASWMYILILIGAVTLPAIVSAYYLIGEIVNNFQRLYYNEGYIQAGFGFLSILSSLTISTYLINAFLAQTITAMCMSAGFSNPIGWAFLALSLLTLVGAAALNIVTQSSLYNWTAILNRDALCPQEPGRFSIDEIQASRLFKGIDRNNIQTVITAIHHDMSTPGLLGYNPFFLSQSDNEKLSAIRTLRTTGRVDYETTIGEGDEEVTFNFTTSNLKRR